MEFEFELEVTFELEFELKCEFDFALTRSTSSVCVLLSALCALARDPGKGGQGGRFPAPGTIPVT